MAQVQPLALLARRKQEDGANHYRPHASPDRDVDPLLVLCSQFERAQLGRMGITDVAETAIHQRQHAGHDQYDCQKMITR